MQILSYLWQYCSVLTLWFFAFNPLVAFASIQVELQVAPIFEDSKIEDSLKELKIKLNFAFPKDSASICFWLPYQSKFNPNEQAFSKRFQALAKRPADPFFSSGYQKIIQSNVGYSFLNNEIVQFIKPNQTSLVSLELKVKPPRLSKADPDLWLLDYFHPILMDSCPNSLEDLDKKNIPFHASLKVTYDLKIEPNKPKFWNYIVSPNRKIKNDKSPVSSKRISLALTRNYQKIEKSHIGPKLTKLNFYFKSEYFKKLIPDISESFATVSELLSGYPFKEISLLETDHTSALDMPGLIAINAPRQGLFKSIQENTLNWNHWIFTQLLVSSWINGTMDTSNIHDRWLLDGLIDYISFLSLKKSPLKNNILDTYKTSFALLTFDYEQLQEATAILLKRARPNLVLTGNNLITNDFESHPYIFMRHSLALKAALIGISDNKIRELLADFRQAFYGQKITPRDFIEFFGRNSRLNSKLRKRIETILLSWWKNEDWPDFSIEDIQAEKQTNKTYITRIKIQTSPNVKSPIPIELFDNENKKSSYLVLPYDYIPNGSKTVSISTEFEPGKIEIDPSFEIFDFNRFNNSNRMSEIKFFPGNATTLYPSDYTFFWFPSIAKRPGESFSLGIQSAIFKYLHSTYTIGIESGVEDGSNAFVIKTQHNDSDLDAKYLLQVDKNFEDHTTALLGFTKYHLLPIDTNFAGGLILRNRSSSESRFQNFRTASLTFSVEDSFFDDKEYFSLSLESEKTISDVEYAYERSKGVLDLGTRRSKYIHLALRSFFGSVSSETNDLPSQAKFKPNDLAEAKIRIDAKLPRQNRLRSSSIDLYIAAPLAIPDDLMILSRRTQIRLFSDFGKAETESLFAAGFGLRLPLGGDVSGAGELPITQINVLTTLISRVGNETDRKPHFLLSLDSSL